MGYSCDAAAAHTMDAIGTLLNLPSSNGMPDGGFYERGRENADGAITGTVWKPLNDAAGHVIRRGGYRIEPDGKVTRFPGLPAPLLRQAEQIGKQTYQRDHGPIAPRDWRKDRAGIIACLDDGVPHEYLRDDVQACTKAYQTDKGIAFLVLPALNTSQAIVDFLNGL